MTLGQYQHSCWSGWQAAKVNATWGSKKNCQCYYFTLRVDWSDSIAGARAVVVLCDEKECYERAQKNGVLLVGKNYLVRPEVMPLLKLSSRALSAAKA